MSVRLIKRSVPGPPEQKLQARSDPSWPRSALSQTRRTPQARLALRAPSPPPRPRVSTPPHHYPPSDHEPLDLLRHRHGRQCAGADFIVSTPSPCCASPRGPLRKAVDNIGTGIRWWRFAGPGGARVGASRLGLPGASPPGSGPARHPTTSATADRLIPCAGPYTSLPSADWPLPRPASRSRPSVEPVFRVPRLSWWKLPGRPANITT